RSRDRKEEGGKVRRREAISWRRQSTNTGRRPSSPVDGTSPSRLPHHRARVAQSVYELDLAPVQSDFGHRQKDEGPGQERMRVVSHQRQGERQPPVPDKLHHP